jgi:parallel beta-helix repeat protein
MSRQILRFGIALALLGVIFATGTPVLASTTTPGGTVSGTWTASGSPYLIDGDITVPSGQTLTIEPGVEVIFQSWYKLTVSGTLLAEGTESSPILFTGIHPTADWLGIRFFSGSDASRLTYVIVEKGRATGASPEDGGGGIYVENSSPTISYSTIRDNFAKRYGGGIYLTGSNATLMGNTITNNSAGQGGSAAGGGIFMLNSNPELTGNVIRGNWVYVSGSFSTPTGAGGGIFARSSDPVLRYNVISDNRVDGHLNSNARGGGLHLYYSDADLINNTITGNTVGEDTGGYYSAKEGGGIYIYWSSPTVVNTVLWNDTPQEIFVAGNNTLTVAYSDVQGGQGAVVIEDSATINWLKGNIDADPLFVDPANGDWSLQSGSSAIDAGTAYFEWDGRVLVDLGPDEYNGAAPDMGALESEGIGPQNQPPVAVASANPEGGPAPLTVQFSSGGSYDPDGTIVGYAWNFGDGNTSTEANPIHTYTDAGTYQATLTVTDDDGATGSDVIAVTVSQASQDQMHVEDQTVTRVARRKWAKGRDLVLVTDQSNQPVAGATVTAIYSGPNQGQVSGTTGADGTVLLETPWVRRPRGEWCFEVVDVSKDGYIYNPDANVVTDQCESG